MSPSDFRAWRRRLGFSQAAAARALGLHVQTVKRYERDPETALDAPPFPVPRVVHLACIALEQSPQDKRKHSGRSD